MTQQQQAVPLMAVVSHLIKSAGPSGCTMADLGHQIKEHHPQWKPTSASPAVSNLVWLGCVRQVSEFGTRKLFHVRDYDLTKDRLKLSKEHYKQQNKNKQQQDDGDGVKMLIAIGKDQTTALTFDEAKALYLQLHKIFGGHQ